MRALVALMLALALGLAGASAASAAPPRVTVFGDSVQASFGFVPQAVRHLAPGLRLRMEARVCRRLSAPGCLGGSPPPVQAVAESLGPALGEAVVVHVGYNDVGSRYDVAAALRAFERAGVRAVVWVTLRESRRGYAQINSRIRAAVRASARRPDMPVVRVADWNGASAGRPWFTSDGVHLNPAGAMGLAALLRQNVLAALADAGVSVGGRPATARGRMFPLGRAATRIAGDGDVLRAANPGRLVGIDERTGRRLPGAAVLVPGEDLASDGRQAWLRDAATGSLRPATGGAGAAPPPIAGIGTRPLLARAGTWLWAVAPCPRGATGCPAGQLLRGTHLGTGERRDAVLRPGRVRSVAASARGLWVLVVDDGAATLERRDPRTGRRLRLTRLPRAAAGGHVAALGRAAWVLAGNGQLLRVDAAGRARRVLGGLRAVAAAGDQLWALQRDRRTVVNLHPATGRPRVRAIAPRRLSDRMTFTRGHVWVLTASGTSVLRLRRA